MTFKTNVTKVLTFDAAHHLVDYEGPCANLHGHTYKLEVTIGGTPDPQTGMIVDFNDLKSIVQDTVLDRFDHKNINDQVDYNPTAENMALDILNSLVDAGMDCVRVRWWETPTSYATVTVKC